MIKNTRLLDCLTKKKVTQPLWMFRQAGRYLPEYLVLRQKQPDFLKFCYTPEYCIEAVLQPVRRYDLDAAIVFSDILVVPDALGQKVWFEGGVGPKLLPLSSGNLDSQLSIEHFHQRLSPVYQAIEGMVSALDVPLIGFSGSPWTLACYMIEGQGSRDFFSARRAALTDQSFPKLIEILEKSIISYLIKQIESGVRALQLFDSWSGVLSADLFEKYVVAPTQRIVAGIHRQYPHVPVVAFARGAGLKALDLCSQTGVAASTLDEGFPLDMLQNYSGIFQGNLDPAYLLGSKENLKDAVKRWKEHTQERPWVYNLGHGVHKDTSPEMVSLMITELRKGI